MMKNSQIYREVKKKHHTQKKGRNYQFLFLFKEERERDPFCMELILFCIGASVEFPQYLIRSPEMLPNDH